MLTNLPPWGHQEDAFNFAYGRNDAYLAMAMGTGKSLVACALVATEGHKRVLVLCPCSVRGVWRREVAKHFPTPYDLIVLEKGTSAKKATLLQQFLLRQTGDDTCFVVVNYETAWRPALRDVILSSRFDCVILDEAHRIKSPGGKSSRFCQTLGRNAKKRLCLSGTPMPHSPLDLYGQFRFLSPSVFGTSFARFRARYAVVHEMFPGKVLNWINQDELQSRFHAHTFQCGSDVLDLPESTHTQLTAPMPIQARRPYVGLRDEMVAEVKSGTVTVANALVKLLRLQQITSGYLPTEDSVEELHCAKKDLLKDMVEDLPQSEPVVVFCRFRHDLDAVATVARETGRTYGELSGRRRDLTETAEMPDGIELYGVQVQSGGVGIDLTKSCYAVYYSLGFSLGDYEQSQARLLRPGQTRSVHYYHLIIEDSVDAKVYASLRDRKNVVEAIMQLCEEDTPW